MIFRAWGMPDEDRQKVCDWLRQHDINPNTVPDEFELTYSAQWMEWVIERYALAVYGMRRQLVPISFDLTIPRYKHRFSQLYPFPQISWEGVDL